MWSGRRIGIAAVLAVVIVAGITLMLRLGGGDIGPAQVPSPSFESPAATATGAEVTSTIETSADEPGTEAAPSSLPTPPSVQFERTADGARSTAVAYLESTEIGVTLQPTEAAAWARESASAAYADEFAADTESRMIDLWETIPEGITLRLAPIETRVVSDGAGWLVSVWFVEAITIGTVGVVDDWRTATYRMVWENSTWKIDDSASDRGPMPGRGTNPASARPAAFEALLAGFDDEGLS